MSSVTDKRTSRKLTQGEIREEAEFMVKQNQIEAKKSTNAQRVASRLHYEKLLSLGIHKPSIPIQTRSRYEDNLRMARPRPSQQMLRAKQHYIGVGERIRRDHQLQTLGFTRTPHFNPNLNPQKRFPTDTEKPKSITSVGGSPTKAPVPEPFHIPVYRTISPSFFSKLHNAIKVGYAKPDPSNGKMKSKTWLEREAAQKVVQNAAIDLAAKEVTADLEVKKSRSGKSLKPKSSMSLKDAQNMLSLSHAPSFPMIDLHVHPKSKITSDKMNTSKTCCKVPLVPENRTVNSEKKRLRFADESVGMVNGPVPVNQSRLTPRNMTKDKPPEAQASVRPQLGHHHQVNTNIPKRPLNKM